MIDMKVWYPLTFKESKKENLPDYILSCQLSMYMFKLYLRKNINSLKWNLLNDKLKQIDSIEFLRDVKAISIANQYISCLQCNFDNITSKCYFYVPETVRCFGTNTSLNYVIKIIEYGNDIITPLNWIRHSYIDYCNSITKDV